MQREFSTGGIVYKKMNGGVLWLVAKSSPSKKYPKSVWRLPKGWIDEEKGGKNPGPLSRGERKSTLEELQSTALREVREEGGIGAKIIKKIGTERFFYTHEGDRILKFVTFYLMEWVKDLPEGPGFETEKVEWLIYENARKKLTHSGEKKMLDRAHNLLSLGIQDDLI